MRSADSPLPARAGRGRALRRALAFAIALAATLSPGRPAGAQPAPSSPAATPGAPAAPRPAMSAAARDHLDRGLAAYRDRAYRRAAGEFRAGYAIDPHPDFLFPWAQAERLAGDCAAAVRLYRELLATPLPPAEELEIRRLEAQCAATLAAGAPGAAGTPGTASGPGAAAPRTEASPPSSTEPGAARGPTVDRRPTEAIAPAAERPAPAARPWYRDRWGGALAGGSVAALAVGAGFLASAHSASHLPDEADTYEEFRTLRAQADERVEQRSRIGFVALGVGGALAVAAIVRYATAGDGGETAEPSGAASHPGPGASIWVEPGDDDRSVSIGAAVSGRF